MIEVQISTSGQHAFTKACKKRGREFAEGVIESECQLHADNLGDDVFSDYSGYEWMQDFIKRDK